MKNNKKIPLLGKQLTLKVLLAKNPISSYKKLQKSIMVKQTKRRRRSSGLKPAMAQVRRRRRPSKRPSTRRRSSKKTPRKQSGRGEGRGNSGVGRTRKRRRIAKVNTSGIKRRRRPKIPPSSLNAIYANSFR